MNKRISRVFNQIHASEDLKKNTIEYLRGELTRRRRPLWGFSRTAPLLAFLVALFFTLNFTYRAYFAAEAYIDIDINPSVELSINRFGKVIEVSPYNEDGANILEGVKVRYTSWKRAVETILDTVEQEGYFNGDGLLSVTVWSGKPEQEKKLLTEIERAAEDFLQLKEGVPLLEVFPVSEEVKSVSRKNRVTPAKYLAITELQSADPQIRFDQCRGHSLSQLRQLAGQHGHSHGNGHGNGRGEKMDHH